MASPTHPAANGLDTKLEAEPSLEATVALTTTDGAGTAAGDEFEPSEVPLDAPSAEVENRLVNGVDKGRV